MLYISENGFILQALVPDTNPPYPVTDSSYLFFSTEHNDGASLAGDPIKGSERVRDRNGLYPAWGKSCYGDEPSEP